MYFYLITSTSTLQVDYEGKLRGSRSNIIRDVEIFRFEV